MHCLAATAVSIHRFGMRCELLGCIFSSIATELATYISSGHCCRYKPLARPHGQQTRLIDGVPSESLNDPTEHALLRIDTTALKYHQCDSFHNTALHRPPPSPTTKTKHAKTGPLGRVPYRCAVYNRSRLARHKPSPVCMMMTNNKPDSTFL